MSKIEEWVDNATDQEIVAVMTGQNHRQGMALWRCLQRGDDVSRVISIHRYVSSQIVDWLTSEEFKAYKNHEDMLPEYAKAEFTPAATAPKIGSLHGDALIVSNEDPAFPTCLKDAQLQPVLNFDLSQYQWAPTSEEAKEAEHYELGNYDAYMLSEAWKDRIESRRQLSKAWQKRTKGEV